jgi:hypothetical protein
MTVLPKITICPCCMQVIRDFPGLASAPVANMIPAMRADDV